MPTGGLHFAGAGPLGVRVLSGSFWGLWVASNEVGLLGLTGQGRGGRETVAETRLQEVSILFSHTICGPRAELERGWMFRVNRR
jgi:hypothetical protein